MILATVFVFGFSASFWVLMRLICWLLELREKQWTLFEVLVRQVAFVRYALSRLI